MTGQADLLRGRVPVLHCFVVGCAGDGRAPFYTAIAVGSHGKFVGGSCGRTHDECRRALEAMERTFRERWSAPFVLEWSMRPATPDHPEGPFVPTEDALVAVRAALALQHERLWGPA